MGFNIIKLSLGSLAICFIIVACNNNRPLQSRESKSVLKDSCRLERSAGSMAIAKVGECRHCHLMFDVPRMRADIPILNEIAALDSLKLSDYLFKSRHKGMYPKSYPSSNKAIDSLDDCERKNLIHFIKNAGRK